MALLNPTTRYVRAPQAPAQGTLIRSPQSPQAHVVFSLKRQPPINFNVSLNNHAMAHGLHLANVGFHPHPTGIKLSADLGGHLENAKTFANSAISKFSTYIHSAELRFGNQAVHLR